MPRPLQAKRFLLLIATLALLGAAAAVYSPGLKGPFLLDDKANLPALGAYGPVDNATTLVSYLTSGIAGPTGRPLALASFLMDAHDWPAKPWPFKLTNLLFHLLNGVLLALLLGKLSRLRGLDERRAAWAGLLGAGLWLVHPLFVSTTLYVIQRMAELAALFVISGLITYLSGRRRLALGHVRSGYLLMALGIGGGTFLGTFCKEDAALLPLLALVLEWTVLAAPQADTIRPAKTRGWLAFRALFLWLPSLAVLAFLVFVARHPTVLVAGRGFSVLTRLTSEPRALVHYLYLLVVPHAYTGGLFTEMAPSRSLLHPWTTLPSILLVLGLIGFGFAVRRRWPALAAAILFYFAAQLVESTTVPLELYFEHRNYIPALLAFWPLALWLVRGGVSLRLRQTIAGLAIVLLLALTFLRASLWGNENRLWLSWARMDPHSARAIIGGAQALTNLDHDGAALRLLRMASIRMPDNAAVALNRLFAACRLREVRPADFAAALYAVKHDHHHSSLIYQALSPLVQAPSAEICPQLTSRGIAALIQASEANPQFRRWQSMDQQFIVLQGRLMLAEKKPEAAYHAFTRALAAEQTPDVALLGAAYLGAGGRPRLALRLLDHYEHLPRRHPHGWTMARLHRWWLNHTGWYRESLAHERHVLEGQLAQRQANPGG